ncbi:hypothetical protein N0V83_000824 [Neocucurbitaria cava]|uniref:Uncharacterized protein n=1 Tax=Neocucurbitaria cava TaxID=798079 RepID=A0A9W9CSH8_9PLEO|nr:hypothetical protein N0V83_000824 [Neocucurbitaria cava]
MLSFSTLTDALAVNRKSTDSVQEEVAFVAPNVARGVSVDNVVERQDQVLDCPDDRWQQILDNNPPDRVMTFCNEWLGIGPATTVVEWTPTIFYNRYHFYHPSDNDANSHANDNYYYDFSNDHCPTNWSQSR